MPTPNPQWREIADDLRQRIDAGEWAPGETLPSMRQLKDHYEVSSHGTIQAVIQHLVGEGLLMSTPDAPRRGVTVRARPRVTRDLLIGTPHARHDRNSTFEQQTAAVDVDVQTEYEITEPPEEIAQALGLEPGEPALLRTFLYTIQGTPHQIMNSWMPASLAAEIGLRTAASEVPGKSTQQWLEDAGYYVERAYLELESRMPNPTEIAALALPNRLPVIVRRGYLFDQEDSPIAVEMSAVVVVADQVMYNADIRMPRRDR